MSSNYAVESVQKSQSKFFYSPAPEGLAEIVGSAVQGTILNVASGALTSLAAYFPTGTNGVFLVDIVGSNAAYSITSVGVILNIAAAPIIFGFNNATMVDPATPREIILEPTATSVAFTQTSGGALNFTINIVKLATISRT